MCLVKKTNRIEKCPVYIYELGFFLSSGKFPSMQVVYNLFYLKGCYIVLDSTLGIIFDCWIFDYSINIVSVASHFPSDWGCGFYWSRYAPLLLFSIKFVVAGLLLVSQPSAQ